MSQILEQNKMFTKNKEEKNNSHLRWVFRKATNNLNDKSQIIKQQYNFNRKKMVESAFQLETMLRNF